MQKAIIFLLLILLAGQLSSASQSAATLAEKPLAAALSFKDWKRLETQLATEALVQFKQQKHETDSQEERRQLEWNLQVANDLSIKEYVLGHLSKLNPGQLPKVASLLSADEMALILKEYLRLLNPEGDLVPSLKGQEIATEPSRLAPGVKGPL